MGNHHMNINEAKQESVALPLSSGLVFAVICSLTLVAAFYFRNVLNILNGWAGFYGVASIQRILSFFLQSCSPILKQGCWPTKGSILVSRADVIAVFPTMVVMAGFLWNRNRKYELLFWDTILAFGVANIQKDQKSLLSLFANNDMPNMKIPIMLLSVMFFYDIYWVFLSPACFGRSVMGDIAQYRGRELQEQEHHADRRTPTTRRGGARASLSSRCAPLLWIFQPFPSPVFVFPGGGYLGTGDILIPGYLASSLLLYDQLSDLKHSNLLSGYFVPCVIAYAAGLLIASIAGRAMLCRKQATAVSEFRRNTDLEMGVNSRCKCEQCEQLIRSDVEEKDAGQPALMYLVPCMLGTTLCLALCRGELPSIWDGVPRCLMTHNEKLSR
eukprot:gnl/TRDRNA2_/TRDRNA2_144779_c0_seq2.p1 gnl/TRDRNA2_/TRDRNA2_144779_c0~~gnl/TRDRNA2_/TRDRNA2_144779_c0_seq2.p1  ORF type:complete len:412 (-),score=28.74 gnl/TRDRNA2_/TRDRNA2_144779_c0_seq2:32-1186(-)